MSDQEIAAKLGEAAKLLHGAASAFRHGRRTTGVEKWVQVRNLLKEAQTLVDVRGYLESWGEA